MDIKPLDLQKQYEFYLKQVGLSEEKMHAVQKVETKRAFMAGFAQALHLMNTHISQMDEDNAVRSLKYLEDQCAIFWSTEKAKIAATQKEILVPKEQKIITLNPDLDAQKQTPEK